MTDPEVTMYDLDKAILERRSVRGFLPRAVPRDVLQEVLSLAQHAPSNCNVQPWRVYIASGKTLRDLRAALVEAASSAEPGILSSTTEKFFGDYRAKQVACAVELYGKMGVERDDRTGRRRAMLRNYELFDAPHVAYVCMAASFGVAVALDVGMYVQTLMLAMCSRGIASCPQASLRAFPEIAANHLGIPADEQILCGLSFGYEDPTVPANRTRQPREPVSHNVVFRD